MTKPESYTGTGPDISSFIPDTWTAEQALMVHEFLESLIEAVWQQYEVEIIDLIRPDQPDLAGQPDKNCDDHHSGIPDYEIPF